jgi:hypothetical protein
VREIKFRGKDINGHWYYGLLSISPGYIKGLRPEKGYYISNSAGQPWAFQVRPETVAQYTERKDKNGVEIYERDIIYPVGYNHSMYRHEIKFISGSFGYYDTTQTWYSLYSLDKNKWEIIGNIDDNPELMKVKDEH